MKTKIIGLTGGIGSGKTTVASFFKEQGVPLYIADDEAKVILYTPEAINEIRDCFGEAVMTNGIPDRAKLANVVFKDPDKLKLLNGIIHPKLAKHFQDWLSQHHEAKFIIREAAILFESGSYKLCDKIILVTAPVEIRIERVMKRDQVSRDQVLARMSAQWDDDKKAALSDFIIENLDVQTAKQQTLEILKILNKIEN